MLIHYACSHGHTDSYDAAAITTTTDAALPDAKHLAGTANQPPCPGAVVTSLSAALVKRVGEKWGVA